jgi:hypothetical protein
MKNKIIETSYLSVSNADPIIDFISKQSHIKNIFIHYLTYESAKVINKFKNYINIVCCFYGGDFFNLPEFEEDIYQETTFDWYQKNLNRWGTYFGLSPLGVKQWIRLQLIYSRQLKEIRASIYGINYFCHYIFDDLQKIQAKFNWTPSFVPFTYGFLEEDSKFSQVNDNNLLVGNSADVSNNHVEIFKLLANFDLGKRKVIVPLSYPKQLSLKYGKWVADYGKYYFGDNFYPLFNLIPLMDYNNIINSCSDVFMNHCRSQAGTNNITAIGNGANLYLNNQNTLFQFYKNIGIKVFDINTFNNSKQQLSKSEVLLNKEKVFSFFGKEAHLKRRENLANTLEH